MESKTWNHGLLRMVGCRAEVVKRSRSQISDLDSQICRTLRPESCDLIVIFCLVAIVSSGISKLMDSRSEVESDIAGKSYTGSEALPPCEHLLAYPSPKRLQSFDVVENDFHGGGNRNGEQKTHRS